MTEPAPPTPVWLLTGFLGSGKTTLLARLLRAPGLTDTAVIVNEFGEVGIDHVLVARGEENSVVLLEGGCLCCAIGDSLGETLTSLFHRRARGEVPPFSRVVIETTGLADPGPILRSLIADRVMMQRYAIAGVIVTIDGLFCAQQMNAHEEARRQLAVADRVVVTKRDLIDIETHSACRALIERFNARADILSASNGEIDPGVLLAPLKWSPPSDPAARDHGHGHAEGLSTIFLPLDQPLTWARYAQLVQTLQSAYGERLLRAKGLVRIVGEPGVQIVQGVQHLFAPPVAISGNEIARAGLVLIGERLDADALSAFQGAAT